MKTVLVTGATGFLGRHLVENLLERREAAVRLLCRRRRSWTGPGEVEIVEGDILDPQAVERAVAGVSGIFHLAGLVSRDPAKAALLFDTHIRGTGNLCRSALAHRRPKIVLVSSSGTIAASRAPRIYTEDSPYSVDLGGRWPYYLSKIYQEKLALSYFAHHQLPVVVVNPSLLLGPGDERLSSTGDVALFLGGHFLNNPGGGLNFVDVRDAAAAVATALNTGVPGRRYLIGGHNMTVKEFFALLERISGMPAPRWSLPERWSRAGAALLRWLYDWVGTTYPVDDVTVEMGYRFWYFDSARAQAELGLRPRPAEETLRDTVDYLRQRAVSSPPH
ncbi:MAG: NAD-dependent epimerase/dehydratase family protein [Acidobacteria bacterium]|nr:NAD-dependent epimerase/dehydratase family protein [Acidobacteriota bacterium]